MACNLAYITRPVKMMAARRSVKRIIRYPFGAKYVAAPDTYDVSSGELLPDGMLKCCCERIFSSVGCGIKSLLAMGLLQFEPES
jgi:hypothetical protein